MIDSPALGTRRERGLTVLLADEDETVCQQFGVILKRLLDRPETRLDLIDLAINLL